MTKGQTDIRTTNIVKKNKYKAIYFEFGLKLGPGSTNFNISSGE